MMNYMSCLGENWPWVSLGNANDNLWGMMEKGHDISWRKFCSFKLSALPEPYCSCRCELRYALVYLLYLKLKRTLKLMYFASAGLGTSSMESWRWGRCCKVNWVRYSWNIPSFLFSSNRPDVHSGIFSCVCVGRCLIRTLQVHYFWSSFLLQIPFIKAAVVWIQLIPS